MSLNRKHLAGILAAIIVITSCGGETGPASTEVQIGNQIWTTQNLSTDTFRNGDPIPHIQTSGEWREAAENQQPAWTYYQNDTANGEKFGKLYNWHAVNDPRGLAPEGWRIPDNDDWAELVNYLGGEEDAVEELQRRDGFYALAGGYRGLNAVFGGKDQTVYWWSADESGENHAYFRPLNLRTGTIGEGTLQKMNGHYVRLVRE